MSIWSVLGGVVGGIGGFIVGGPAGAAAGAGLGASIGGGADSNNANQEINTANTAFNAQQAELNRQWQERMSNTAYQRSRADMEKAGLNPMLAATNGGASTPSGGQASAPTPIRMEDAVSKGVASAGDLARTYYGVKQMEADTKLKVASELTERSNAVAAAHNARTAKANADVAEAGVATQKKELEARGKKAKWDSDAADYDAIANRVHRDVGSVSSATDIFNLFKRKPNIIWSPRR